MNYAAIRRFVTPRSAVLFYLAILVLTATALHATAAPSQAQGMTDRQILEALYDATGGDGWTVNTNWKTNAPLFEWSGVTVDVNDDDRVIGLRLENNGLTGEIPVELSGLTNLERLWLDQNRLTGTIPSELRNLTSLTQLALDTNRLTGEIPVELGALTNLTTLYLSGNDLTGKIPTELGDLSNLTHLYLHRNQLSGEIPSELGNLTSLTQLALSTNRLTGELPTELGDLSNLSILHLHRNQLSGEIPSELGNLTSLTQLALSTNRLTGEIPTELGDLSNLTHLYLHQNQLTGEIPSELGGLEFLLLLDLSRNRLTGEIPSQLGDLTNLRQLNLSENRLTGQIPFQLAASFGLTSLNLSDNELTGAIPSELGGLPFLTELSLSQNRLTGEIPTTLGDNPMLRVLDLSQNQLTGAIPSELGGLTMLTKLDLSRNRLTGEIPVELGTLAQLTELILHGNALTAGWNLLETLTTLNELTIPLDPVSDEGLQVRLQGRSYHLTLSGSALPESVDPTTSYVRFDPDPEYSVEAVRLPYRLISEDSAIGIDVFLLDADREETGQTSLLTEATVCVSVPISALSEDIADLGLAKYDEQSGWSALEPAAVPSGFDAGPGNRALCGKTIGFSVFVPADLAARSLGTSARVLRIEPRGPSTTTLSPGDTVKLSFDIYGRQDILDNALGEAHVFEWDDGAASGIFRTADRSNAILYTAPSIPGRLTVTVNSPAGICHPGDDADERCAAQFNITVRRPSAVPEDRPAPMNPQGEIPSVLVDAEGRQYEVFTPEEGGAFDGGDVSLSADPGVIPNLEFVGVRVDAAGPASNVGASHHRYTLGGRWHEVSAVDADGDPVSDYRLEAPLQVCVPLPPELRSSIAEIVMVALNPDDTLTVLGTSVRYSDASISVCGGLGRLSADVAVGRRGSPDRLPTPVAEPDATDELPDTGGGRPSMSVLLMLAIVGTVIVLVGRSLVKRRREDRIRIP